MVNGSLPQEDLLHCSRRDGEAEDAELVTVCLERLEESRVRRSFVLRKLVRQLVPALRLETG